MDIPLDLQIETLLRLQVKSLLRFRCVSKRWSFIITSRKFRKLHTNIASSSSPTPILIAFVELFDDIKSKKFQLVSLPNPNISFSSYKDLSLVKIEGTLLYNAVRGLICFRSKLTVWICNPSTRQLHIIPKIRFKDDPYMLSASNPNYFFGYDPVKGEYKVLAIDKIPARSEHKVVVLGGEEEYWSSASWRACLHFAYTNGMCMNGNLYYGASRMDTNSSIIVSFNLTLETFNIINVPTNVIPLAYDNMWAAKPYGLTDKTLINYRGKIGVVETPREGRFRMWVVEDTEKEEWSVDTFHLPQSAVGIDLKVMETFSNGEICLVSKRLYGPFCLFYYNLKTKCMRIVLVEGLQVSELKRPVDRGISVTVSDHYENFMFLDDNSS